MNIKPKYSTQSERLYFEQRLTFKKTQKNRTLLFGFSCFILQQLIALFYRRNMDTVNGTH